MMERSAPFLPPSTICAPGRFSLPKKERGESICTVKYADGRTSHLQELHQKLDVNRCPASLFFSLARIFSTETISARQQRYHSRSRSYFSVCPSTRKMDSCCLLKCEPTAAAVALALCRKRKQKRPPRPFTCDVCKILGLVFLSQQICNILCSYELPLSPSLCSSDVISEWPP